jgi:hypothetical protein
MVTRTEVQNAVGRTVGPGREEYSAGSGTCDYMSRGAQVSITLQHVDGVPDLAAEMGALEKEIEGAHARPAPAFGPCAFYLDIPDAGGQLHMFRGRDYLLVSVLGFGDLEHTVEVLNFLARAAIARM